MSTPRLTFLYPHLFRTARLGESTARVACRATRRAPCPCRCESTNTSTARPQQLASFGTSNQSSKPTFPARRGKGVPPKPLGDVQGAPALETPSTEDAPQAAEELEASESSPEQKKEAAAKLDPSADSRKETLSSPGQLSSEADSSSSNNASQQPQEEQSSPAAADGTKKHAASGPMDAILHLEPPENAPEKHPHLSPPPYVHHFDSYSLVKQLEDGGWTNDQAITAMKAVRGILAQNLDVAQDSLVSKSDVENETYLFRAACSELGTEVKKNRRVADEQLRQQRTLLQHEVDIASQSLNQELLTLNDNVKGMFNDRKIAVREEQKAAESAIQQLNYKISVNLTSDSKSEIEGLRWVLIRRSVLGIIFMALLMLGTLRYTSYLNYERQKEADRAAREAEERRKNGGKHDQTSAPDAAEILAAN